MLKNLLLTPLMVFVLSIPALAEKIPLSEASKYLNALQQASGDFTQINADGTVSTGKLLIKRPGRMRFEYAAPDNSLVIAGGSRVAVFDAKSNQAPEQFPLNRTPLGLILARNVNLNQSNMVVGHDDDGTATTVKVQDPKHPEYGNIQLKFTNNPVELRQWIITDDSGVQTTVILGELDRTAKFGPSVFNIVQDR